MDRKLIKKVRWLEMGKWPIPIHEEFWWGYVETIQGEAKRAQSLEASDGRPEVKNSLPLP